MSPQKQVARKKKARRSKYDSAWKEVIEKLETSTNPMAMVVKAQLKSFEVKKADENTKFEVNERVDPAVL